MKKLFFILLSGITVLNLTSCLSGSNRTDLSYFAVVSYNVKEGLPSILTVIGEFAAPDLAATDLQKGDCIGALFTVDFDHQPAGASIYHATNIRYDLVGQSFATVQNNFDEKELIFPATDLLPFKTAQAFTYSPILEGKFFFKFVHSASKQQEMKYIAIVKPNVEVYGDKPVDLYLIAQKTNKPDAPDADVDCYYAFDLHDAIQEFGKETTYGSGSSVEYRVQELKAKIKFCTGLDEEGIPEYKLFDYLNASTGRTDSIVVLSVFI